MSKYIIQFNEANFDLIKKYCKEFSLPNLEKLINLPTQINTTSERKYESLEPWIQWYSFYTSKNLNDHGAFHLGDCLKKDHQSIFDKLVEQGLKVGIFSSMNHKPNKKFTVYIPDPWTEADPDESISSSLVSKALNFVVNNNSSLKINFSSLAGIFLLLLPSFIKRPYLIIDSLVSFIKRDRVRLAPLFDSLFLQYCISRSKKENLDVSAIFLNGLAHLQHHYLKKSKFIKISCSNKEDQTEKDPILIALEIYDKSFKSITELIDIGKVVWVITGLTQEVYAKPLNYWRFKDHKKILSEILNFNFTCYPRMTRDFELVFNDSKDAIAAKEKLENCLIEKGKALSKAFGFIDARNNSLFASFIYSGSSKEVNLILNSKSVNLQNELDFVAVKNGGHAHFGWAYSNSNLKKGTKKTKMAIWDLANNV